MCLIIECDEFGNLKKFAVELELLPGIIFF